MQTNNKNQDFFEKSENFKNMPLASRMRPKNLDEFIGQAELLERGKILRNLIESDNIPSMIFWGPPGCGKTTLATIISGMTKANFINFSATFTGIKEIKNVMIKAEENRLLGEKTIIFIDEIHRFNKSQQDAFLPFVENGSIILIGATTENPSFEVNSALISRLKVFVFKALDEKDLEKLLNRALASEEGFGKEKYKINIDQDFIKSIAKFSNGDARSALNTLEVVIFNGLFDKETNTINVSKKSFNESVLKKTLLFDKNGEEHYNLISAFHKSMRNSDPDAAVYYLARMLESGEDPLYIARRIIRFSSEDIGLSDPHALLIAVAAFDATRFIGMPECSVNLTEAALYMSLAPKSNALYNAYNLAKKDCYNDFSPVPMHLRNAPTKLMKELGYGKGYEYAHDKKEKLTAMECLPENLKNKVYYSPTDEGLESKYKTRLENIKKLRNKLH